MRMKDGVDHCYTKQERWRLKKLAEGGCVQCGKPRENKEVGHCSACLEKKKAIRLAYKKKLVRLSWEKNRPNIPLLEIV